MNIRRHQVPQGLVDEPVLGNPAEAEKLRRSDPDCEMPATVASAGMAGMQVAFVNDFALGRLKRCVETAADGGNSPGVHGMTWTNGLTVMPVHAPATI